MREKQSELELVLCKKSVKALVAFAIPVLLMLFLYYGVGIYPYYSKTVLMSDLSGQYVNFFAYLKDAVFSKNGLFYSFSKTLGGDMAGMSAYYLLSPLNIIFLFVDKSDLPQLLMIITLAKLGLAGCFYSLFLGEKGGYYYRNVIFSTAYALSGYTIAFAFNLMWMDAVYLAPLVLLGVERIFSKKGMVPYMTALFFLIVSCYYTGYMVCIFVAMYVAYRTVSGEERIKEKMRSIWNLGMATVIGLGMAVVVLIPAITSQNASRSIGGKFEISTKCQIRFMEFVNGLFGYNGPRYSLEKNLPYVFFTIPLLYFAVAFYFNKKIKVREKISILVMEIVFVLSTMFITLDAVWHGFASPNQFYFRYTFLFIFVAIFSAWRCYENIDGIGSLWKVIGVGLVTMGLLVLSCYQVKKGMGIITILMDMMLILLTIIIILKQKKMDEVLVPIARIGFFLIVIASILFQGNDKLVSTDFADNSLSGYVNEMEPCIAYIDEKDRGESFYRIEKTFYNSLNDAMLLNYHGLSHFSSSDNPMVLELMENLGYTRNQDFWCFYNQGSTLGGDSLLGVKYIISRKKLDKKLTLIATYENINIYKNNCALGLVFAGYGEENPSSSGNIFEYQNSIYQSYTGLPDQIYKKVKSVRSIRENERKFHYQFTPENAEYIYMAMPLGKEITLMSVKVNNKNMEEYFDVYNKGVMALGGFRPGSVVDVVVEYKGEGEVIEPLFYSEDYGTLMKLTKVLKQTSGNVQTITDSHLKATVTLEQNGRVITTIPYSENWKVTLDGKEVQPKTTQNCLMAIENVSGGTHKLEFQYTPKHLVKCALVSAGFFIIYLGLLLFEMHTYQLRNKTRKTGNGNEV
ncbi:MAG: YfhO family protein [Eubacterium sp.]|nr:YfhO family protein [Eubacterium sp.]